MSEENSPGQSSTVQNYLKGIRLLEIERNAQEFFRTPGQVERAALVGFILPTSTLN